MYSAVSLYKMCCFFYDVSGGHTVDIPASVPWFEAWRETFLQVQFPSDHEFTKHYIACILCYSFI